VGKHIIASTGEGIYEIPPPTTSSIPSFSCYLYSHDTFIFLLTSPTLPIVGTHRLLCHQMPSTMHWFYIQNEWNGMGVGDPDMWGWLSPTPLSFSLTKRKAEKVGEKMIRKTILVDIAYIYVYLVIRLPKLKKMKITYINNNICCMIMQLSYSIIQYNVHYHCTFIPWFEFCLAAPTHESENLPMTIFHGVL